jgi:hypothetical protein
VVKSYFAKRNIFMGKVAWNSYLTHGLRQGYLTRLKIGTSSVLNTTLFPCYCIRNKVESIIGMAIYFYICLFSWHGFDAHFQFLYTYLTFLNHLQEIILWLYVVLWHREQKTKIPQSFLSQYLTWIPSGSVSNWMTYEKKILSS